MQNYIGTVLRFDEKSYNDTLKAYGLVLKAIDEAGAAYEGLDSTFKFDQEVFKDMMTSRSVNIHKKYAAIIVDQIKALKFTSKSVTESLKNQIVIDISALEDKIEKIFIAKHNVSAQAGTFSTIYFDENDISIIDGKAALPDEKKEKIKDKCEIKIRTEDQSTLYTLALKLQKDYEAIRDFIKEKNPKAIQNPYPTTLLHYNSGRLSETQEGELLINPNTILFGI